MNNLSVRIIGVNNEHFDTIVGIVRATEKSQQNRFFFVHGRHMIDHLTMKDCTNVDMFILAASPDVILRIKEVVTVLASDTRKEWNKDTDEEEFRKKFLENLPKRFLIFDKETKHDAFEDQLLKFK